MHKESFLRAFAKRLFLIATILLPIFIFGFYAMMIYFSVSSDSMKVAVVDEANIFNGTLDGKDNDVTFELVKEDTTVLRKKLQSRQYDAYLLVPPKFDVVGKDELIIRSDKAMGGYNMT